MRRRKVRIDLVLTLAIMVLTTAAIVWPQRDEVTSAGVLLGMVIVNAIVLTGSIIRHGIR